MLVGLFLLALMARPHAVGTPMRLLCPPRRRNAGNSGNWLVPTYNGELFAHKPPLSFWLMAFGIRLFGEGESAVRFFSAPAMAASTFLTFIDRAAAFDDRTRSVGDGARSRDLAEECLSGLRGEC